MKLHFRGRDLTMQEFVDSITDEIEPKVWPHAWLIWRQGADGPEFLGMLPSKGLAEAEVTLFRQRGGPWHITPICFMGGEWTGVFKDNVFNKQTGEVEGM
jgi:hypothetical protein